MYVAYQRVRVRTFRVYSDVCIMFPVDVFVQRDNVIANESNGISI